MSFITRWMSIVNALSSRSKPWNFPPIRRASAPAPKSSMRGFNVNPDPPARPVGPISFEERALRYARSQRVVNWLSSADQLQLAIDGGILAETAQKMRAAYGLDETAPFQDRVAPWLLACFGPNIARDRTERSHRFIEEALELVQAAGCTASDAHQLVDYVFDRPVGELQQEVGGVMVTLAALCLAHGAEMHAAGETELARIWTKIDVIRAKQAAKPKHSPLPESRTHAWVTDAERMDWMDALPNETIVEFCFAAEGVSLRFDPPFGVGADILGSSARDALDYGMSIKPLERGHG